jgi:hypothetical protein
MSTVKALNPPEACDTCGGKLKATPHFYDGKTRMGPWAWMCSPCFMRLGSGLGTGKGQKYSSKSNEKVGG